MARRPTDDELLAELAELRVTIEAVDPAYARRRDVWAELTDRGVDRGVIAEASGVGRSAVGFALYKARKTATG